MEMRILAAAIEQVAHVVFSENVGVVSGPSAKRWADSLTRSAGVAGLPEMLARAVGARMAGKIIEKAPFGRAIAGMDIPALPTASLISTLSGRGGRQNASDLGEKIIAGLSGAVPGLGAVREVAMLDGNLLFHEPLRYVKQSRKALKEALTALPVEVGAVALAAEALLKGGKVRTLEPGPRPPD